MPDFEAIRKDGTKAARDKYYRTHTEQVKAKRRRWYRLNSAHARAYAKAYRTRVKPAETKKSGPAQT